ISRASPSGSARRRKPSATTAAPRSSLEEIRDRPRFSSPATNCIQMTSLRLVNPSKDYEASYRSLLEEFKTRGETLIPFPLSLLARHGLRDPGCFQSEAHPPTGIAQRGRKHWLRHPAHSQGARLRERTTAPYTSKGQRIGLGESPPNLRQGEVVQRYWIDLA